PTGPTRSTCARSPARSWPATSEAHTRSATRAQRDRDSRASRARLAGARRVALSVRASRALRVWSTHLFGQPDDQHLRRPSTLPRADAEAEPPRDQRCRHAPFRAITLVV